MAMRTTIVVTLSACLMAAGTRASSERPTPQDKQEETKSAKGLATATAAQSSADDPAYKIGPQDVLKIDVWKEEQLTRTVPVRPDGKITLPLLNDVQAVGFTQFARVKNIYVLRTENGKQIKVPFNYKEAISGKNVAQNIELQAGDVIVVP